MMVLLLPLIIAAIALTVIVVKNKIKIDVPSFFKPTLPLDRGVFGVYCYTGHQGSGKTYGLNKFVRKNQNDKVIYSNMTLKGIDYIHIESVEHLFSLINERDCIIIYDEIFGVMAKSNRMMVQGMEFLSQMRKQKIIFLTTAQYWLELSITFRRFVRVQVECSTRALGRLGGIFKESYYDTTQIQWDNLANEYVSPIIATKYSKYEKKHMESYDTHERILNKY